MADKPISATAIMLHAWFRRGIENPLAQVVGGRTRLRIITLLACVLSLDAADKATIGAVAGPLMHAMHIDSVQVGWLITASTAIGALITLPFGMLADRVHRVRLLILCILAWSLAMVTGALSGTYLILLLSRFALGAVAAAALPIVVSLTGDYFMANERGRIFGYILVGELLGIAFGFLISGNLAGLYSWHTPFWVMAALGVLLALAIGRYLPEPERGRQAYAPPRENRAEDAAAERLIREQVREHGIEPHAERVLKQNAESMSLWQAVRYVLGVRSFVGLILASGLGYFFFAGLRTFGVVFMRAQFGFGQSAASSISVVLGLGSIAGVLLVGRLGDRLVQRGRLNGRVLLGGAAYLVASVALLPGVTSDTLLLAAPFLVVAAAGIGGANPAVDASRLDVIPPGLWGRAEGVRTSLRYLLAALAPPMFAYVATWFGGSHDAFAAAASGGGADAAGLEQAFLIMLPILLLAGLLLVLWVRRTYTRDAATALASSRRTDTGTE